MSSINKQYNLEIIPHHILLLLLLFNHSLELDWNSRVNSTKFKTIQNCIRYLCISVNKESRTICHNRLIPYNLIKLCCIKWNPTYRTPSILHILPQSFAFPLMDRRQFLVNQLLIQGSDVF